jgi:hypothetical protein
LVACKHDAIILSTVFDVPLPYKLLFTLLNADDLLLGFWGGGTVDRGNEVK